MIPIPDPPICMACIHLNPKDRLRNDTVKKCDAFPKGIPAEILMRGGDHRRPFKGDQGIQFELRPGFRDSLDLYEGSRL